MKRILIVMFVILLVSFVSGEEITDSFVSCISTATSGGCSAVVDCTLAYDRTNNDFINGRVLATLPQQSLNFSFDSIKRIQVQSAIMENTERQYNTCDFWGKDIKLHCCLGSVCSEFANITSGNKYGACTSTPINQSFTVSDESVLRCNMIWLDITPVDFSNGNMWSSCTGNDQSVVAVNEIYLEGIIEDTNNSLPSIEITSSNVNPCINNTGENVAFEYTVNAVDPENDTILYQAQDYNYYFLNHVFREDFVYLDEDQKCFNDFDFFNRQNYIPSNSTFPTSKLQNDFYWVLSNKLGIYIDANQLLAPQNKYPDTCIRGLAYFYHNQPLVIDFGNPYNYDSIVEYFWVIPIDDQIATNHTILDGYKNEVVNMYFNMTGGNLTIIVNGTTRMNAEYNEGTTIFSNINFTMADQDNPNEVGNVTIDIRSFDSFDPLTFTLDIPNVETIEAMAFDSELFDLNGDFPNPYVLIDSITVTGTQLIVTPEFTEVAPNITFRNTTGRFRVEVFVSDDAHFDTEYVSEIIEFNVGFCADVPDRQVGDIDGYDFNQGMDSLNVGIDEVCTTLDNAFSITTFGTCFTIKFAYAIIGLFIAMALGIFFSFLNSHLGYGVTAISFFFWFWFGTYILNYSAFWKVMVVVFGFTGVIQVFLALFWGGSASSSGGGVGGSGVE